jgi:putative ABC transport system permease protein
MRRSRLLRLAARLVPRDIRAEWFREWDAEIQHAERQGRVLGAPTEGLLRRRSLGALVHAAWLRWDRWRLEMLWDDIRSAARGLVRRPGFVAASVLALALGIGANATIFAAVEAVLLRPLPFSAPEHLVQIISLGDRLDTASPPDFVDWRRDTTAFSEMAAFYTTTSAWSGHGLAEQIPKAYVTGGFFDVLGVPALYGRTLGTGDDPLGSPDVVVLSHDLWVRRFGGDPSVVGQTMTLDGAPYRIVGVMPASFGYPFQSQIWVPLRFTAETLATQRGAHFLRVIARRRAGVSLAAAQTAMTQEFGRLGKMYPDQDAGNRAIVRSLQDGLVGDVRPSLLLLLGAVGCLLLVVCVNVGGLMLTRSLGRSREFAVRTALGAGRTRLVALVTAESALLALAGAAAGLVITRWATGTLSASATGLGIPFLGQARIDGAVVAFTLAVALAAAVFFGGLPAVLASGRLDVARRIHEGGGNATGAPGRQRLRRALVAAEAALAVVLLVGAGLLARSLMRLVSTDLGFEADRVGTFSISLSDTRYKVPSTRMPLVQGVLDGLRARPDVDTAAAIYGLPLTGFGYSISMSTLDGRTLQHDEQIERSVQIRVVTPDYFRTMGVPVVRGRAIADQDRPGAEQVVVVNETAAARLWPHQDPLGRRMTLGTRLGVGGASAGGTVVGVVGDVRDYGADSTVRPTVYQAYVQFPVDSVSFVVKDRRDATAFVEPARTLLANLDPDLPMFDVRTMDALASQSVAERRLYTVLIGLFAVAAILLVAVGMYGLIAEVVSQRTREIGIRLALGAARRQVVGLVAAETGRVAVLGLAVGLGLAAMGGRAVASLLFGVTTLDAPTYLGVAVGVLAVSAVAAGIPAWRAARIDPARTLRGE